MKLTKYQKARQQVIELVKSGEVDMVMDFLSSAQIASLAEDWDECHDEDVEEEKPSSIDRTLREISSMALAMSEESARRELALRPRLPEKKKLE
jgi:hypothetical protein